MDVNEAISAVADDGFIGEEDDDFEDLYNDVNIGENFLQSLRRKEDVGTASATKAGVEKKSDPAPSPAPAAMINLPQQPVVERRVEDEGLDPRVSGRGGENYHGNLGYRAPAQPGGGGFRVELGQSSGSVLAQQSTGSSPNQPIAPQHNSVGVGNLGNTGNDAMVRQVAPNVNTPSASVNVNMSVGSTIGGGVGGGNGTILFVGELHWWTTDAELETELSKYGPVKEVKFFDERASGKSKGYCQVEFYDPIHATSCKEGMNGHTFNGRPCVVAFASPFSIKKMGEAQVNRNQQMGTGGNNNVRKGPGDLVGKPGNSNIMMGGNYQGGTDNNNNNNNRGYGRGNWGRGNNQGMGRGGAGPMRGRGGGGMGGRGAMGNGGGGFGQGIGATPPMMHHQSMMSQGFDPAFGGPMGRMGGYGGFPGAPTPPFSGMFSSFPPVGGVGLPGVAPHVNPAFFGRGMPMNGMGMMPGGGVEGPNMGMWPDPNMGGWGGEEHGGRAGESSYAEEAISDHQYGESHDRGAWQGVMKEKDRGSERDWSGSSERRVRDDRELGFDRDTRREKDTGRDHDWSERGHRDDRAISRDRERDRDRGRERSRDRERDRDRDRSQDRHRDHRRYKERDSEYDDEWARGRSSRAHS